MLNSSPSGNYIHRIWMNPPMPKRYATYGLTWAGLNPDWSVIDWTGDMVWDVTWQNQDVLDDMRRKSMLPGADLIAYYTQVADVVCYELLHKHGGWYVNTDVKPLRPLASLEYDRSVPALAYEDDIHLVNMAMYSPIKSQFMGRIIENLAPRYFGSPDAFMNATTGVGLIMDTLRERDWGITTFPREVFNPIHFTEFEYGETPEIARDFGDAVAVHEWGHRTNQRAQRILP